MNPIFKKLIANNLVMVATGLPNLGINIATQFVLDVVFHWTGFYALLAYLIGVSFSMEYSIVWAMLTKSNFKLGNRSYSFSHKEDK